MATLGDRLWSLWDRIRMDDTLFWLIVAGLLVIIVVLVVIVLRGSAKRRRQVLELPAPEDDKENTKETVFVPIDSEKDTAEIFLPLSTKLVADSSLQDHVSKELVEKIRSAKPQCLEEIMQVWHQLRTPYQDDLRRIMQEEQLFLLYARTLGQNDYQPFTLAFAYQQVPDPALLPEFMELLASRVEAVQMAGVRLLSEIKAPQLLPYLASAVLQPQRYVPARVADVLIAMGESAAWLLVYLLGEIPSASKPLVLSILAKMQVSYPLEQVLLCLQDPEEQTRRAAVVCLGEIGSPEAIPALCQAALDPYGAVRAACAKAMGQIGDPAAIPLLQRLTTDHVWMVAVNAREALRSLEAQQKIV